MAQHESASPHGYLGGGRLYPHALPERPRFVGNSPTILARSGQDIRWYVFNLDLGETWHNFHPHSVRFSLAGEMHDVRSMGPAESFVVDTKAPPVILLPAHIAAIQPPAAPPPAAQQYRLTGDFLFHCHVHHHMASGMVGLVRAYQDVWLTPAMKQELEDSVGIQPFDASNPIPDVDPDRCREGTGEWEELAPDPQVAFMHACLLPGSGRVLYWGYTRADQSRLFDPGALAVTLPANQPANLPGLNPDNSDLWSASHAFLNDAAGSVVAHGGFTEGPPNNGPVRSFTFDPTTDTWAETGRTAEDRFYATTVPLADGRLLTLYGSGSKSIEVLAAGAWSAPIQAPLPGMAHHQYYPWTYVLPDGRLFIAGPHVPTQRFVWSPAVANVESFSTLAGDRSSGGEKGTSLLLTLRPPNYEARVMILGGDFGPAQKTAEIIDLSVAAPAWSALPDLNVARPEQVNSVLLPDGRVVIAGGTFAAADGGPCELFDPEDPGAGWRLGPSMKHPRGYHSAMILLQDGSVLMGGDPNSNVFERYLPSYVGKPRPAISAAPAAIGYGAVFQVGTPQAPIVSGAVILRPGAVTHGFNMSQRAIECSIVAGTAASVDLQAPPNGNVAPPGWYLLFLLDANRVPSLGRWLRLS